MTTLKAKFNLDMSCFDLYDFDDDMNNYIGMSRNKLVSFMLTLLSIEKCGDLIIDSPITFVKKLPCPIKKCFLFTDLSFGLKESDEFISIGLTYEDELNAPYAECRILNNSDNYKAVMWVVPYGTKFRIGISMVDKSTDVKEMLEELEPYCDLGKFRKVK